MMIPAMIAFGLVVVVTTLELDPNIEKVWLKRWSLRAHHIPVSPPWIRNYKLILSVGPREYRWKV